MSISTTTSSRSSRKTTARSSSAPRASKPEIGPTPTCPYYPAVWSTHLQAYAAAARTDSERRQIGYTVEVAWSIGDLPLKNGTKIGMEFVVNALRQRPQRRSVSALLEQRK